VIKILTVVHLKITTEAKFERLSREITLIEVLNKNLICIYFVIAEAS